MNRTLRAAIVADLIGLVLVGGTALLLGIPWPTALVSGLVAGAVLAGVILAAAARSDSMTATPHDTSTGSPAWDDRTDDPTSSSSPPSASRREE